MRYLKGSVSLRNRDRELLHVVSDARYITHSQLFQLALLMAVEFERPVFNWRVRRLVNSGLMRKQIVPYLGADALNSITRGGVHARHHRSKGTAHLRGVNSFRQSPAQ